MMIRSLMVFCICALHLLASCRLAREQHDQREQRSTGIHQCASRLAHRSVTSNDRLSPLERIFARLPLSCPVPLTISPPPVVLSLLRSAVHGRASDDADAALHCAG